MSISIRSEKYKLWCTEIIDTGATGSVSVVKDAAQGGAVSDCLNRRAAHATSRLHSTVSTLNNTAFADRLSPPTVETP